MMTWEERFWKNVDAQEQGCWHWRGGIDTKGYGEFTKQWRGHTRIGRGRAHRLAYEMCVGEIPKGLDLDHLCRNRRCVNPSHLEPVTHRENLIRGIGWAATRAAQTHCKRGHEFTEENIYRWPKRPHLRACKACIRDRR